MGLYRKKPVVIEARQFYGGGSGPKGGPTRDSTSHTHAIYLWIERNTLGSFEPMGVIEGRVPCPASGVSIDPRDGRMMIATLEGPHWVNLGDWVICGAAGEFYPCTPDIFDATYEAVVARDERPHSRACGIIPHDHGTGCHSNCPTCGGV